MDDSKWERWSALGGILFVALVVISVILPGNPPKTSDSAAKIAKFVGEHRDDLRWAGFVGGLATVAILFWFGSVWRLLRRSEGGAPRLAVVALGGGVFATVMATVSGVMLGAVAILGVAGSGGATGTKFFYILATNIGLATGFGIAAFIAAFSAVILRTGVLPSLLGWFGALIALGFLVGTAGVASTRDAFFVIGFIAFFAFLLWVLVVSVLMLRGTEPEPVASAT